MRIISIDPGEYSTKFLAIESKKKSCDILFHAIENSEDVNLNKILGNYLGGANAKLYKLALIFPEHLTNTRTISLPVKSKKKAEQLIPFQIEDSLPTPLAETHYTSSITVNKDSCDAFVSIVKKSDFDTTINKYSHLAIPLAHVTSMGSLLSNYFHLNKMLGNYCVIDVGHSSTKVYFFKKGNLIQLHKSFCAGKMMTQAIAEFYKISFHDAQNYKHQSAFFLTDSQYAMVNSDQKVFGNLMSETMNHLINDIKRWLIGYKLESGENIDQVFITGGGSLIKNFHPYLAEKIGKQVSDLHFPSDNILNNKEETLYFSTYLTGLLYPQKRTLLNYLIGNYSPASDDDIPLHSMAFIGVRLALLTSLILLAIMGERYFIKKNIEEQNKQISALLKNNELEISKKDRLSAAKKPSVVLTQLNRKIKTIKDQATILENTSKIDAVSPLLQISSLIELEKGSLVKWESSSQGTITGAFESSNEEELNQVEKKLKDNLLPNLQVRKTSPTLLEFSFSKEGV